jgi:hypothetical protein
MITILLYLIGALGGFNLIYHALDKDDSVAYILKQLCIDIVFFTFFLAFHLFGWQWLLSYLMGKFIFLCFIDYKALDERV